MSSDVILRNAIQKAATTIGMWLVIAAFVISFIQPVVASLVNRMVADSYRKQAAEQMRTDMQDTMRSIMPGQRK